MHAHLAVEASAQLVDVDELASCGRWVRAELEQGLRQMAAGRGDQGVGVRSQLVAAVGEGSPLLERVDRASAMLLTTAAGDLFGKYDRRVDEEVQAYRPRILSACAT